MIFIFFQCFFLPAKMDSFLWTYLVDFFISVMLLGFKWWSFSLGFYFSGGLITVFSLKVSIWFTRNTLILYTVCYFSENFHFILFHNISHWLEDFTKCWFKLLSNKLNILAILNFDNDFFYSLSYFFLILFMSSNFGGLQSSFQIWDSECFKISMEHVVRFIILA